MGTIPGCGGQGNPTLDGGTPLPKPSWGVPPRADWPGGTPLEGTWDQWKYYGIEMGNVGTLRTQFS